MSSKKGHLFRNKLFWSIIGVALVALLLLMAIPGTPLSFQHLFFHPASNALARKTPVPSPTLASASATSPTAASTAAVVLEPTTTPTVLPAPVPYYKANWSQDAGDWTLPSHWSWNNGMLVADGREFDSWIFPAGQIQQTDYTLQVRLRWQNYTDAGGPSFGVVIHHTANTAGYICGTGRAILPEHYFLALGALQNNHPVIDHDLKRKNMTIDQQWHTYRIDVQGNRMALYVDNSYIFTVTDNTYSAPGQVGLYASAAVIDVTDFQVLPLGG